MIRRKPFSAVSAALVLALLLMTLLGGCGRADRSEAPAEPALTAEPADTTEPVEPSAAEPGSGRENGERYEGIIVLEGMEETVKYEHVRNDALGFELDYDYENFVRHSEPERECFISCWDDPDHPEIYLEVTCRSEDADTVAASIGETLSKDYEIIVEACELDGAGSCIRIDASNGKGGTGTPDLLQTVYIIPAADGCRVAAAHYTFESAEGFGVRFRSMMNTFAVISRQGA